MIHSKYNIIKKIRSVERGPCVQRIAQAEALQADPALLVAEADGAADAGAPAAKPAPPPAAARTRRKNGAEASNG